MANRTGQKWAADDDFGKRLKDQRDRKGWTQAELADHLSDNGIHITAAQIARLEKDQRSLRAIEATVLADLYGISVDALLGRRARPKADLMSALRAVLDTKDQARWAVSVQQRALSDAAGELAACDTEGRYAELVADCEDACKTLDAAEQVLAGVGETTNPAMRRVMREAVNAIMRAELAEEKK